MNGDDRDGNGDSASSDSSLPKIRASYAERMKSIKKAERQFPFNASNPGDEGELSTDFFRAAEKVLEDKLLQLESAQPEVGPFEKVKQGIEALVKQKTFLPRQLVAQISEQELSGLYRIVQEGGDTWGKLLSVPTAEDLGSAFQVFLIQDSSQNSIDSAKEFFLKRAIPRIEEAHKVYTRLKNNQMILDEFKGRLTLTPDLTKDIQDYLRHLINDSHEEFVYMTLERLIDYREGLKLSMDLNCDREDLRAKVIKDIRGDNSPPTFILGYASTIFEIVFSDYYTQFQLASADLGRTMPDIGTKLLGYLEVCRPMAERLDVEIDQPRIDKFQQAYKTGVGSGFETKESIREFSGTIDYIVGRLDATLSASDPSIEREQIIAARLGSKLPSFSETVADTKTRYGLARAFHKAIILLVSISDPEKRAKSGGEQAEAVTGMYSDIEEASKACQISEMHGGFSGDFLPYKYPKKDKVLANFIRLSSNPSKETARQLGLQLDELVEAKNMYMLHKDVTLLAFFDAVKSKDKEDGRDFDGVLNSINDALDIMYTGIEKLEGRIQIRDSKNAGEGHDEEGDKWKLDYMDSFVLKTAIESFKNEPKDRAKLDLINSELGRLYEVMRTYNVLAESQRDVDALMEGVRLEGEILTRGQALVLQASYGSGKESRTKVKKNIARLRRSFNLGIDLDVDYTENGTEKKLAGWEAELADRVIYDLQKGERICHMIKYATLIYRDCFEEFEGTANLSCTLWDALINTGKNVLEVYGKYLKAAEQDQVGLPEKLTGHDSRYEQLKNKYNRGQLTSIFEPREQFCSFIGEIYSLVSDLGELCEGVVGLEPEHPAPTRPDLEDTTVIKPKDDVQGAAAGVPPPQEPAAADGAAQPDYGQPAAGSVDSAVQAGAPADTAAQPEPSYDSTPLQVEGPEDTYQKAIDLIEEHDGQNQQALELLRTIEGQKDVSAEIDLIGKVEFARYRAGFQAAQTESVPERAEHYRAAVSMLEEVLTKMPTFRGALASLKEYKEKLSGL